MSGIIGGAGSKSGVIGQTELQRFSKNYDRPGDGHYSVDSYTKLLVQSNTTNNSTTFVDSSSFGHSVTRSGSVHHSTDHAVIGGSSFEFDGTTDSLNLGATSAFAFDSLDFTIDFWVFHNDYTTTWFFSGTADHNMAIAYGHQSQTNSETEGKLEAWASTNGSSWNHMGDGASGRGQGTEGKFKDGVWNHLAMVRESNVWKLFCNGELDMIAMSSGAITNEMENGFTIGTHGGHGGAYGINGWVDEFRISIGIARWSGPFRVYTSNEF